ncbi:MAG TPA: ATP-binding protein [Roseiflexaceae bacterium]
MSQMLTTAPPDRSLSALMQVMDAANGSSDPRALAQAVLERALAVTAVASGSIWLRERDDVVCLARCPNQPAPRPPQLNASIMRVLQTGRPEMLLMSDQGGARTRAERVAILPLIAQDERIGALVIGGVDGDVPRTLLDAIAAYIAGALQQARLAEQIEAHRQRIQAIRRQQDQLINIISHDLKNPMASIKGYADLLLRRSEHSPDDPNRRGLEVISEQVVRMTGLLDQLLDIARISSERLRIERRPADLNWIVSQVVEELREATGRRELVLKEVDLALPGVYDRVRVGQAISNVVSNAIAYSPHGSPVVVLLERSGQEAIISIRDQGIGIPAAEHDRVFEPFFRAHNAAGQTGMGMGLFVAQQILARHDGRIWFESDEGEGSTFYIALPLTSSQGNEETTRQAG